MKRLLKDVVVQQRSSLKLSDVAESGKYPVFGAAGLVGYRNTYQTDLPSVAIIKDGAGIGRVSLLPKNSSVLGTMQMLTPNADVDNVFLYYYLTHLHLGKSFTGSTIPHIYFRNYGASLFPRFKHDEQVRIAIDLTNISNAIENKHVQLNMLDGLVKSRFMEMFGDPNGNPLNWQIGKISDVAKCVAGATPSTSVPTYWENGSIPWLSSGEVNKYRIYETDSKITQEGYAHTSTKMVPAHTVVLAMAGQGKTRGTAAMAEISLCTNQSICSLVNNEKINPEFLLALLKNQYDELRAASNGAEGRGGLNLKIIGSFPIYIPPIELQNDFARFVKLVDKSRFVCHSRNFL